ncbi:MAG: hypothetical protein WAU47_03000 [Desulfobaccales bacterium]
MMDYVDRDLDQFIANVIMGDQGIRPFTSSMTEAWRLVKLMIQKHYVELKLDMFLGVTGELWVASFYSPSRCVRYEGRGASAPLAICRAAKEAFIKLTG